MVGWAKGLSASVRTDLLIELSGLSDNTGPWMTALAQEPLEEERLLKPLLERIRAALRGDARSELAQTVVAIRATEPASLRAIGAVILWIVEPRKNFDKDAALDLVPAMQRGKHGMGKQLGLAFEQAEKAALPISKKARRELEDARIPVAKPSLLKGLLGGGGKK